MSASLIAGDEQVVVVVRDRCRDRATLEAEAL